MRIEGDPLAVGILGIVGVGELARQAQRCAAALGAPDQRLLFGEPGAIPELDEHPDDADGLIRTAGRPGGFALIGADPNVAIHHGAIVDIEVRRSVPEPQQVSRSGPPPRLGRHQYRGRNRRSSSATPDRVGYGA